MDCTSVQARWAMLVCVSLLVSAAKVSASPETDAQEICGKNNVYNASTEGSTNFCCTCQAPLLRADNCRVGEPATTKCICAATTTTPSQASPTTTTAGTTTTKPTEGNDSDCPSAGIIFLLNLVSTLLCGGGIMFVFYCCCYSKRH